MDWAAFQAFLRDGLPGKPAVNDEAIDKYVEELSSASKRPQQHASKRRHRADLRPPLSASIQDETRLKYRLKMQWQVTRDPALKAHVNCLQRSMTYRLKKWRNDQWINTGFLGHGQS
jgi:hypothetical protein